MRRLRIAVVGAGFGARIHVPGLRASERFDVVALIGRDRERTRAAAARAGVAQACTSLDEALALGLDAVAIATPPASHAALAIAAARAGLHVLCEKPMARTAAEAAAMLAAVRAAGTVGHVDFEFRFHPGRAMLARLVARGALGTPRLLACFDTLGLYVAPYKTPPAWWYDRDAGGGWLGASGSHLVDATRAWLGEVTSVAALVDTLGAGSADDTFALLLRLACGARAVLHQSAAVLGPHMQAFRLAGSEGAAWLDDEWRLWQAGRAGDAVLVPIDADLALPDVPIPPASGPFAARELPCFVQQARAFADAIAGGVPVRAASFVDGLACQRVLDAARAASRSNAWVRLAESMPE